MRTAAATFLAIFFVPFFYKLIMERKFRKPRSSEGLKREAAHHRDIQLHKAALPGHGRSTQHRTEGSDD